MLCAWGQAETTSGQPCVARGSFAATPDLPHPLPNLGVLLQEGTIQLLEPRLCLVGWIPARRTRRERLPPSAIQPFQRPDRRRLRLRLTARLGVRTSKA